MTRDSRDWDAKGGLRWNWAEGAAGLGRRKRESGASSLARGKETKKPDAPDGGWGIDAAHKNSAESGIKFFYFLEKTMVREKAKFLLGCALLAAASAATAGSGAQAFGTMRSGGQYEASLIGAGVPIDGGMAWSSSRSGAQGQRAAQAEPKTAKGSLRSGGQYEASLIRSGAPIDGGLAWARNGSKASSSSN